MDAGETKGIGSNHQSSSIDLTQIKRKYTVNAKSTLQNVLTEYGMPQEDRKKKKPKKPDKKSTDSWVETDDERQLAKQEHYRQIYEDVHKLRDLYYMKYMHALRKHVEKQRDGIQKRSEKLKQHLEKKQAQETENSAKVRQRMQKYIIEDDDDYLKKIPKSDYYKIVQLIDQKKKEGGLRTQSEIDEFWREIRKPKVFKRYFPPSHSGPRSSYTTSLAPMRSRSSTMESHPPPTTTDQAEYRPMTHISEQREPSNLDLRDSAREFREKREEPRKSAKKQDAYAVARQAAQDLDKRFPKMELPALHCFDMEIGEKPRDPEEVMREMAAQQRERERRLHVKKLRRMYQLALSNTASAKRIMDSHSDDMVMIEPSIAELTIEWQQSTSDEVAGDQKPPWAKYLTKRQMLPIEEVSEKSASNPASAPTSRLRKQSARSKSSTKSDTSEFTKPEPPQYLTLGSMASGSRILEPKCLSTMWTNYARTEQPFFITEETEPENVQVA